jgi:predicted transcriptional regulator
MIPQIRILEDSRLIARMGSVYLLTEVGYVLAAHLRSLSRTIDLFGRDLTFWAEHDLNVIPDELLRDIADLGNYQLLTVPDADLFDIDPFLDNLRNSRTVTGIAHHCHPKFPQFFGALAENGVELSLVFTPAVYALLTSKYPDLVNTYFDLPHVEIFVLKNDLKLSCAITDSYFSMSLFYRNGAFDTKHDVISRDVSALRWGERLVEHYRGNAEKIESL